MKVRVRIRVKTWVMVKIILRNPVNPTRIFTRLRCKKGLKCEIVSILASLSYLYWDQRVCVCV